VVSKLLKRIVYRQLYSYTCLRQTFCHACSLHIGTHHSTKTAMLKVLTDILYAVDDGDLSVIAPLDLSAAFK